MLVSQIMTRDPETIGPDQTLKEARRVMEEKQFRHLPVIDNGDLVGVLTDRDIRERPGFETGKHEGARDGPFAGLGRAFEDMLIGIVEPNGKRKADHLDLRRLTSRWFRCA